MIFSEILVKYFFSAEISCKRLLKVNIHEAVRTHNNPSIKLSIQQLSCEKQFIDLNKTTDSLAL